MKCKVLLFFCLFSVSYSAHSQFYYYDNNFYEDNVVLEFGGSLGAMNSLTDLGGNKGNGKSGFKDFNIQNTQLCGSLFLSAIYKYSVALRLEGTFGQVNGDDAQLKAVAKTTSGRYERNLSFRSPISEIILATEVYPLIILSEKNEDKDFFAVQPYLLAGVGYFHFNPQAKLNNNWVALQPLSTEGQGFKEYPGRKMYQLNQVNFPVGIGFRCEATALLNVRLEMVWRVLNTDYLDDVSTRYIEPKYFPAYLSGRNLTLASILNDRHLPGAQTAHPGGIRGDPGNNDSYFNINLKVSLSLNRKRIM